MMRIPKVGERWLRQDGKSNTVVIIGVVAATPSIAIKVQYRYDDGVESEKFLPDFHAKFKEPAASPMCGAAHPSLGIGCAYSKNHNGPHRNMHHEWLERAVQPMPAPAPLIFVNEHPEPVVPTSAEMRRYHGFKPDEPMDGPREGNWNDPDYRARYSGIKS
jgi:hypothetical protein